MDRIAFLRSTALLDDVPVAGLREIDRNLRVVELAATETLFAQDEAGDAVYFIVRGYVELVRDGVVLLERHAPDWVGEFALVDSQPRSASAVAGADVTMLRWERDDFLRTVSSYPGVAHRLFSQLTAKLREDIADRADRTLEAERVRHDLERAREIQQRMLPVSEHCTDTLEISGHCQSVTEVGGDYYDHLQVARGRYCIVIGDVTGHGFYAGLFVAMAKSCLATQVRFEDAPRSVMRALRDTLSLSIHDSLLMTCCYVVLNPQASTLIYANAGHPYPYLYSARDAQLRKLEALDPLLGVHDLYREDFQSESDLWRAGDVLVLYSDGVTETRSPTGEPYGHARLEEAICQYHERSAAQIKELLLASIAAHADGERYSDDMTLIVVKARADASLT